MKPVITIVIPVYNVENYLKRCLDSIINQTYSSLEIILVDDGSSDKSPEICDKYARKDTRIRVIHKINEGVSVARNVGIENATGKYLCFVDSDDFLPKHSIESLYKGMLHARVNLSIGAWTRITLKGTYCNRYPEQIVEKSNKYGWMDALDMPEMKGPVAKLFDANIIKENALRFPEKILVSEDTIFVYQYTSFCDSICIIDQSVYYYNRLSLNSTTTRYYNQFHKASFMCIKEYIKNVVDKDFQLKDVRLQRKIVNDFLAVRNYLVHFQKGNSEEIKTRLSEAYMLFNQYIDIEILLKENEAFDKFLNIYSFFKDGEVDKVVETCALQTTGARNKIKNCLLRIWGRIKLIWIFKWKLGYKD